MPRRGRYHRDDELLFGAGNAAHAALGWLDEQDDPYGLNNDYYWSDRGFDETRGDLVDTPFGQIRGMHHSSPNKYGGTHHTVYSDGQHISWDTDAYGNYQETDQYGRPTVHHRPD